MEVWKPVVSWENSHEVSNFGQVRSIARKRSKQKILNQALVQGYPRVTLAYNGKSLRAYVHHLVAQAFIGLPPGEIGTKRGQFTVNHKDCDKTNNYVDNIEWLTCGDNFRHAIENGRVKFRKGVEINTSKLTPESVEQIRIRLSLGDKPVDIAKDYGVVKGTVYHIKNGAVWLLWLSPRELSSGQLNRHGAARF